MLTARWNGVVLAESEQCVVVERNYYFPPEAVHREYFRESKAHSLCFWKGLASYYDLEVKGRTNKNAAWYYPHPSPLARRIKSYVAFCQWRRNRRWAFSRFLVCSSCQAYPGEHGEREKIMTPATIIMKPEPIVVFPP